ncbi:MAG: prolipoprotein diacylglyceryl transferase [Clostridia bacterium]|nr:prolipoprotein diacylglyceryl transferase [Clostridia bacterium]
MENLLSDRVAFTIFGVDIYWYGVIITLAIVLDFIILIHLCKKFHLGSETPYDLLLYLVPLGIIGARLFSVLFDSGQSITDFFRFRDGGMSIIGGLMGGALGLLIFCLIKKKNYLQMLDIMAPLVILAQAIGRWGNYFNQEVYGRVVTNESLQWFPLAVEVYGTWHYALFFYECILNLLGFVLLISLFTIKQRKNGVIVASYLCFYGAVRFVLEGFRDETYILRLGTVPISKIMSAVMFVIGLGIFIWLFARTIINKRKEREERIYGKKSV